MTFMEIVEEMMEKTRKKEIFFLKLCCKIKKIRNGAKKRLQKLI